MVAVAELTFPVAFGLTLLVEVPIWTVLLRATAVPPVAAVRTAVVVNVVSHPVLWFALVPWLDAVTGTTVAAVALAEGLVWSFEAGLAARLVHRSFGLLLGVSASANLASIGVGLLLGAAL